MAKLGAFCFRSPVSTSSGFRDLRIKLKNPAGHVLAMLCNYITSSLGQSSFAMDDHTVCVVFERDRHEQALSMLQREKKRLENLCDQEVLIEMKDEKATTGMLLRQALHCSVSSILITKGWTLVGEHVFVFGNLSECPLEIISLDIQLSSNDHVVLLLSADVACFHLLKPLENLPRFCIQQFQAGNRIMIDDYRWHWEDATSDVWECCVLPSLREGRVIGFAKSVEEPYSKAIEHDLQLWFYKNGIRLRPGFFYIQVAFDSELNDSAWFPSCLVLTGAGLVPAVRSYRCSNLLQVVEHVKADLAGWEYFNSGKIELEELSSVRGKDFWSTSKSLLNSGVEAHLASLGYSESLRARQRLQRLEVSSPKRSPTAPGIFFVSTNNCGSKTSLNGNSVPARQLIKLPTFGRRAVSAELKGKPSCNKENKPIVLPSSNKVSPRLCNAVEMRELASSSSNTTVNANDKEAGQLGRRAAKKPQEKSPVLVSSETPNREPDSSKENKLISENQEADRMKKTTSSSNATVGRKTNRKEAERAVKKPRQEDAGGASKIANRGPEHPAKAKQGTDDPLESLVRQKYAEAKLKDLNVADLKNFLRIKKCKLSGKKDELIQRVHVLLSS